MRFVPILFFILLFPPGSIFSQASWVHTNGPSGLCTPYLLSNEKYAFVQEADFLYRTTDGLQWEKIEHAGVQKFAIYKDTLIQPLYNSTQHSLKLQISTDNGINWFEKVLPAHIYSYYDMEMNSQGIFLMQRVQSHSLLHKSIDFGETWKTIFSPIEEEGDRIKIFDDKLFISTRNHLFRLDTTGESWEQILLPFPFNDQFYWPDFVVKDSNILIATQDRVYFSHDDGKIWFQLDVQSGLAYNKLTLVGNDVYFLGNFLLRSSDFGNTWDTLSTNVGIGPDNFTGGSGVLLAASYYGDGIFRWDESSKHLLQSNNGLDKGCVGYLSYEADHIWVTGASGVYAYDVLSESWGERMNLPPFEYGHVSTNENGWVVASVDYAGILYLSIDHGLSWDTIHTEYQIDNLQLLGNNIFITDDSRVFRSRDKGLSWKYINLHLYNGEFVPFLDKYYVTGYNKLYYTTDDGLTFQGSSIPIDIKKLFSFENELFGFANVGPDQLELYMSDDAVNWINAGDGFPHNLDYNDFTILFQSFFFRDADHYYAFLGGPLDLDLYKRAYWSPVDEIVWSPFPLPPAVYGMDWLIHDNILYLGGQGMYTSEIVNPYITWTKEISKSSTNLFSITPNPAKEIITLQLENDILKRGIIQIYSINGVQLKTMDLDSFDREINISIADLPEGVYYMQLKGDKWVDVKSFVKTN